MFVDPKNLKLMDPALLHGSLVQDYLLPLLRAWASGRLVDSEACQRDTCLHPIDHHSRSKGRCLHDCGCNVVSAIGGSDEK